MIRFVRILFVVVACTGTVCAQEVPSPESHLGFQVGTDYKLADWQSIVAYYEKLGAASDRIEVQNLGESTEGRPFIMAQISSPENLAQKESIQAAQKRLADPRGLSETDAQQMASDGVAVVLIGCNIHAVEIASSQMSKSQQIGAVTQTRSSETASDSQYGSQLPKPP